MPEDAMLMDLRRRMDGALEVLRKEFGGLRTGRASASLLEPIMVNAYDKTVPLNQVASINVPEPRLITVQVWDKSMVHRMVQLILLKFLLANQKRPVWYQLPSKARNSQV